jgi:hypothetical protein
LRRNDVHLNSLLYTIHYVNGHRQQIPVVVVPLGRNAKRLVAITLKGAIAAERRAGRAAFAANAFGRPFGDKLPTVELKPWRANDNPGSQPCESPLVRITNTVDQYVRPGKKTGN